MNAGPPRFLVRWILIPSAVLLVALLAGVGVALVDAPSGIRVVVSLGAVGAGLVAFVALGAVARGVSGSLEQMNRAIERLEAITREARDAGETGDPILSAMEEGVVLVDSDDSVRYANPAASVLLKAEPVNLRSLPVPVRRSVKRVRSSGGAAEDEFEAGFPARQLRSSAVRVAGGPRVLVVIRDVTEARRVEAMRRDFVENTSHELKTPVAAIQAAAETLRDAVRRDPAAAQRFAEQLHADALRLSRIVADLLDLSRLEAGSPLRTPVRLDRLAAQEAERLREQADLTGVTIEVRAEPVTVQGSAEDLALLVRNLLDNAIRYSPGGGNVQVHVDSRDGTAFLSVRDTGIGIPTRDLPRIFERFYRVDRARSRESGGTGLGLSIAKHVAELHGGRIDVESELGRGSEFRVRLPIGSRARGTA